MALPKFTTTPTPAYQQQPIVRTQNYSDLYMRNFAAAEASTYKTFANIGTILEKKRLAREKKLELEREKQANEFRTKAQGRKDVDYKYASEGIREFQMEEKDDKGQPIESKVFTQLKDWRDEVSSLEGKIRNGDINPATNKPWTQDDAERVKNIYDGNVSTIKPALASLRDLKSKIGVDGWDEFFTKAITEENWPLVSLINELQNKDGYDIRFSMNGPQSTITWTDDARLNEDGSPTEYEYTLAELNNKDWFANWGEAFSYDSDENVQMQNTIKKELDNTNLTWQAASANVIARTSNVKDIYQNGTTFKGTVVTENRSKNNYNAMLNMYSKAWMKVNSGNTQNKWKQFQDKYVVGKPEDEYAGIAINIVQQNPKKYNSTTDTNNDGIPDDAEKLINIIGNFRSWEEGWEKSEDHVNVMREIDKILSNESFNDFYERHGYKEQDKGQRTREAESIDLSKTRTRNQNNLDQIDYLTTALDSINIGLNVDPNTETEEPYTVMFRTLARNYPGASAQLGKGNKVTWKSAGDEENPRTEITIGEFNLNMDDTPAGKNEAKKQIFNAIISSENAFITKGYDVDKLWQGFKASQTVGTFQSNEQKENAKYFADWLEACKKPWEVKLP
tara:strand:+ start:1389 stop:3248 length:1860 start_codon:yes stop_codon:yes gene_type:complete